MDSATPASPVSADDQPAPAQSFIDFRYSQLCKRKRDLVEEEVALFNDPDTKKRRCAEGWRVLTEGELILFPSSEDAAFIAQFARDHRLTVRISTRNDDPDVFIMTIMASWLDANLPRLVTVTTKIWSKELYQTIIRIADTPRPVEFGYCDKDVLLEINALLDTLPNLSADSVRFVQILTHVTPMTTHGIEKLRPRFWFAIAPSCPLMPTPSSPSVEQAQAPLSPPNSPAQLL